MALKTSSTVAFWGHCGCEPRPIAACVKKKIAKAQGMSRPNQQQVDIVLDVIRGMGLEGNSFSHVT